MKQENEIYACAVLMCLDDLSEAFLIKKAEIEKKYSQNPERVQRALSRFSYQLPKGNWRVEVELEQQSFLKEFLAINKQDACYDLLIWENGLDWKLVVALFEKNKSNVSSTNRKELYRAKIANLVSENLHNKSEFSLVLEEFCLKASFLSSQMRFNFHTRQYRIKKTKDLLDFSDRKWYGDLSRLFCWWDNEFRACELQSSHYGNLPESELLENKKNLLINLLDVSFTDDAYVLLEECFQQNFPDQKFSVSRKNEVLFLNYLLGHSKAKENVCVLVGVSFLNRLGVDQFFREHLLLAKSVKALISLPSAVFPKRHEAVCLMVLNGDQNKDVVFVDAKEAFQKEGINNVLDAKLLLDLWKTKSVSRIAVPVMDVTKQESRLDPSLYLKSKSNQERIAWEDLMQMELAISKLSVSLGRKLEAFTVIEKQVELDTPEQLMNHLVLDCVSSFKNLPVLELNKLSKLILKALPAKSKLDFAEFLDDSMYAISDRFELGLDFDQIDELTKNILKRKAQFA